MDDDHAMDTALRQAFVEGCALDQVELDERLGEINRLTRSALVERQDTGDGIVLSFDRTAGDQVRDLVRRERECCGHLEFSVEETDDLIRLSIRKRSDRDTQSGEPAASPRVCSCPICGG